MNLQNLPSNILPTLIDVVKSIIGGLITIIIGYVAYKINIIDKNQIEQSTKLTIMATDFTHVKAKVDNLHNWRNEIQKREFTNMVQQIEDLKDELKHVQH